MEGEMKRYGIAAGSERGQLTLQLEAAAIFAATLMVFTLAFFDIQLSGFTDGIGTSLERIWDVVLQPLGSRAGVL
jgi:hypothetical protein